MLRTNKKILIVFFITLLGLFPSFVLAGGLVPCGGEEEPICTLCHFVVGIDVVIKYIRNIAFIAGIAGVTIAGTMYVVSAGTQLKEQAKKFLSATLVGFIIIFAAWLIIHVLIWLLAVQGDLGIGVKNWYTFECDAVSTVVTEPPSDNNDDCEPTNNGCGGLNVSPSASAGCNFTSKELAKKLECLKKKKVKIEGNIVDLKIIRVTSNENPDWCQQCAFSYSDVSSCGSDMFSCHFGGRFCLGVSQAVELLPADIEVAIAAKSCGFETVYYNYKEWVSGLGGSYGYPDSVYGSVNNDTCGCK